MTMEKKQRPAGVLTGDYKLHFALAAVIGVVGIAVVTAGPGLTAVATFFGPLVISTAFLLAIVAVIYRISPPPKDPLDEEMPGQELMQYVAGNPVDISCEFDLHRIRDGEGAGLTLEKEEEP